MNKKINKIYEKVLRLVYKDKTNLSFDELLEKDKLTSIHQRNLQILMKKMYKVTNDLGPEIVKDIFLFVQKLYNLRNYLNLQRKPFLPLISHLIFAFYVLHVISQTEIN